MNSNIHQLKLHESLFLKDEDTEITVLRVSGGWIYTIMTIVLSGHEFASTGNDKGKFEAASRTKRSGTDLTSNKLVTSTFIPFNKEFNQ